MTYMVVECHPGYAVVLDEAGNFLKVANRRYEVGQMLTEVLPMRAPSGRTAGRWVAALTTAAACLALVLGLVLPNVRGPYASVYVKINPEVRIDVNRHDEVVGITGVNQDGIDLIEGYEYREKTLEAVTDELVDRAVQMGYLKTQGQITISLDSRDETWMETHSQSISHHLQTRLQEELAVTLQVRQHHHGEWEDWEDLSESDDGLYQDPENPNRIIIVPDWEEDREHGSGHDNGEKHGAKHEDND